METCMVKITNTRNGLTGACGLMFMPGSTILTANQEKVWEAVKGLPHVQKKLDEGSLVEGSVKATKDASGPNDVLTAMKPKDAIALVKDTFNLPLLGEWSSIEEDQKSPRASVLRAIAEQIDIINAAEKDPKKAEPEE
jgi:hypothetical protein